MKSNSIWAKIQAKQEAAAQQKAAAEYLQNIAKAEQMRKAVAAGFRADEPKTSEQRLDKYAIALRQMHGVDKELYEAGWKFQGRSTTGDLYANAAYPGVLMTGTSAGFYFCRGIPGYRQPSKEWHELGPTLQRFNGSPMKPANMPSQPGTWITPELKKEFRIRGWQPDPMIPSSYQKGGYTLSWFEPNFLIQKDGKLIDRGTGLDGLLAAVKKIK